MPINEAQLIAGTNYQFEAYNRADPVDQFTTEMPLTAWLIANKEEAPAGNQLYNEKVLTGNQSNYQNYEGDDQVSYNRRDVVRLAKFPYASAHDGFGLNEDELAQNGITLTDETEAVVSEAEKIQIVNLLKVNRNALKAGFQEEFDVEMHLDGAQNPKSVNGLDFIISTNPNVGTVGGIDSAVATYWRNNASLNISTATPGNLLAEMELMWRACMTYGGKTPNAIFCGSDFLDAYKDDVRAVVTINVNQPSSGGLSLDGATDQLKFHGVTLVWDPTFDKIDDRYGPYTIPWRKRCYFLNSAHIKLRPIKGHWMVNRKPKRMHDRYVHYWGMTAKYRMTSNKRNAMAVLSVA